MKRCGSCRRLKRLEDFGVNRTKPDGLQSRCKLCRKKWFKTYYQKNSKKHYLLVKSRRQRLIKDNLRRVFEYLVKHPCVDCGEDDVLVLDFDHVRGQKRGNIRHLIGQGLSWNTIQEEIEKCEVRCANDHRRRTLKGIKNCYKILLSQGKI